MTAGMTIFLACCGAESLILPCQLPLRDRTTYLISTRSPFPRSRSTSDARGIACACQYQLAHETYGQGHRGLDIFILIAHGVR